MIKRFIPWRCGAKIEWFHYVWLWDSVFIKWYMCIKAVHVLNLTNDTEWRTLNNRNYVIPLLPCFKAFNTLITGYYVITLRSVFNDTIAVKHSLLFIMNSSHTLAVFFNENTNSDPTYKNHAYVHKIHLFTLLQLSYLLCKPYKYCKIVLDLYS